eukprot:TRINITY_DN427_c0_g1_i1.p1 TRINITY_DN427_c0_g1~~TRINITY_DN427_c0_g1_i1.p1  ORF type:complete len:823 (+),score=272.92 TRINITY_DN427_c0_g1_i1:267-2735(+)
MRIMIKGGVWKNTEDEILKAAVMKYGKNQWSRVASLLHKKSSKQCKARWYEWLDPSIKKTEWSREEEEKLLHLAKLMPCQWRTIAPIVGRTATQCLERYEKLLDAAQPQTEDLEEAAADDPRRLRAGEIDPNPEARPARPDPVDMDEDEKEMLQEARARLANTKGKKAKRKARERQLEEARRLASLQKRRELKAAGIESTKRRKKKQGIDYATEIPFLKTAPGGFYETSTDGKRRDEKLIGKSRASMDGKAGADGLGRRRENKMRREDKERQKKRKDNEMPAAIMQLNRMNDPDTVRRFSKLSLPTPQIGDAELEEIAKLSAGEIGAGGASDGREALATDQLLANYGGTPTPGRGATPGRTPMRSGAGGGFSSAVTMTPGGTPARTPARQDTIMSEAQNLIKMINQETPLLGGANPDLNPSDYSGLTPRHVPIQTPNLLLTPLHGTPQQQQQRQQSQQRTPGTSVRAGMPGGATPIRDELAINEDVEMSTGRQAKRQAKEVARKVGRGLASLPAPQYEYEIVLPDVPVDTEEGNRVGGSAGTEDSVDRDRRMARVRTLEAEKEFKRRSQAVQRELPRPTVPPKSYGEDASTTATGEEAELERAGVALRKELLAVLLKDAVCHPVGKTKVPEGAMKDYITFDDDLLAEASSLLLEEVESMRDERPLSLVDYTAASEACAEELVFVPSLKKYARAGTATMGKKLEAIKASHESALKRMGRESTRSSKLENRIRVYHTGYQKKEGVLRQEIDQLADQAVQSEVELSCFESLRARETEAIASRTERLRREVSELAQKEQELQQRYSLLLDEREGVVAHANGNGVVA